MPNQPNLIAGSPRQRLILERLEPYEGKLSRTVLRGSLSERFALAYPVPFRMFTIHQLLIFAARSGNLDVMRERIAAGADVSCFDEQHGSALFVAIAGHHLSAVELLLTHGADVHLADTHGQGALEHSLRFQDDSITAALLGSGARLKPHALPHFREALTEHLRRRGLQHENSAA